MATNPHTGQHPRRLLSVVISQVLAAGSFAAQAATIIVDDTSGMTGGGGCSLRDAVTAANTDAVVSGCSAGAGGDSIVLPTGATITLDTVDNGINCLPLISSQVTITGNGSTIQRSAAGQECRLIEVGGGGALALDNVTLSGGFAYQPITKGSIANRNGGGIYSDGGDLTITGATISGNSAANGGGISISNASLTLIDSTVTGNTAENNGGGIHGYNATVYSGGSFLTSNVAGSGGGGHFYFYNDRSPSKAATRPLRHSLKNGDWKTANRPKGEKYDVTFVDSTISGNTASGGGGQGKGLGLSSGGGLYLYNGLLGLDGSPLQTNTADAYGGGAFAKYGGVVAFESTISGNTAGFGGGLANLFSYSITYNTTIANNEALLGGGLASINGFAGLLNSTISGNRAVSGPPPGTVEGNGGYGSGGGLYGAFSYLYMGNSTVSGNSAESEAAGIAWGKYGPALEFSGPAQPFAEREGPRPEILGVMPPAGGLPKYNVSIVHTTIAFNSFSAPAKGGGAATQFDTGDVVGLLNSIIANPGVVDCTTVDGNDPAVIATLIQDGSCGATLTGDPLLGPLASNGGLTMTHALNFGSPAINAGDPGICMGASPFDQNGNPRPQGGSACSIGSTQGGLGPPAPVVVPILSRWSQALLALMLSLAAWTGLRRRRSIDD